MLDLIQTITASVFVLGMLIVVVDASRMGSWSILGTFGTGIAPVLALVFAIVTKMEFFFSGDTFVQVLGLALLLLGGSLALVSRSHLKGNIDDFWIAKSKDKNRELIITGPYKKIRHPIYTGIFLLYIGLLLNFFNSVTLTLTAIYFAVILYTAFQEEKFLSETFSGYKKYKSKTGMFLPRLKTND